MLRLMVLSVLVAAIAAAAHYGAHKRGANWDHKRGANWDHKRGANWDHKREPDCDYHRDMVDSDVCYDSFHNQWTQASALWAEAVANGVDESTHDDFMRDFIANDGFMDGADVIGMNCKLVWQDPECEKTDVWHFWELLQAAPTRCYLHYGPELVYHNWTAGECQMATFGPLNRFTSFEHCLETCAEAATCNHYDAVSHECAGAMDNIFEEVNEGSRKAAELGINWLGPGVWHVEIEKILKQSGNAKYIQENCEANWPDYRCRYSPHGKLFTKIVIIDIDDDVVASLEDAAREKILTDEGGVFLYDDVGCVDVYTQCAEHLANGYCDPSHVEFSWVETGCGLTCGLC